MSFQMGFPVGVTNLINSDQTFTRTGDEGTNPIFALLGTEQWFGEVLGGQWVKGDDGSIGGFTALINGGSLEINGDSNSSGTSRFGWITSRNRLYMHGGTVIDIHMELPGHTSSQELWWNFILSATNSGLTSEPEAEDDVLILQIYTDNSDYMVRVRKKIAGSWTTLTDPDDDGYEDIINAEGTFRIKIHRTGNISVYFHDGAGDIDTDDDLIVEEQNMGLSFVSAFVSFELDTEETTERTMISDEMIVNYPANIQPMFIGPSPSDQYKDSLKVYDVGSSTLRVYDPGHPWTGDARFESGIFRVYIDDGVINGVNLLYWTGAAYSELHDVFQIYLNDDTTALSYPYFRYFKEISRDKVVCVLRLCDTASDNTDYYADIQITLRRGMPFVVVEVLDVFPIQTIEFRAWYATTMRWGYAGDAESHGIGDDDLGLSASNTTMTDNFLMAFDDDNVAAIVVMATTHQPGGGNTYLQALDGGDLNIDSFTVPEAKAMRVLIGVTPFTGISYLFQEAENFDTEGSGASETDVAGDSGTSLEFDGAGEYGFHDFVAGTNLPEGRYLAVFRIQDPGTIVSNDIRLRAWNNTDGEYRNQEGTYAQKTGTDSWASYQIIFDITAQDVSDTDTIELEVRKNGATGSVYCDYVTVFPIGNGESWPMDYARLLLRYFDQWFNVFTR